MLINVIRVWQGDCTQIAFRQNADLQFHVEVVIIHVNWSCQYTCKLNDKPFTNE